MKLQLSPGSKSEVRNYDEEQAKLVGMLEALVDTKLRAAVDQAYSAGTEINATNVEVSYSGTKNA